MFNIKIFGKPATGEQLASIISQKLTEKIAAKPAKSIKIIDVLLVKPVAPVAAKGFQSGSRFVEYGKIYRQGIYKFTIWNPTELSKKQEAVIHSFVVELTGGLPHPTLTFENVAPWIDVVFQFNRREMTEATFNKITNLKIQTSVFDNRNDHNL